jgi:hypothetical protein
MVEFPGFQRGIFEGRDDLLDTRIFRRRVNHSPASRNLWLSAAVNGQ